MKLKLLGGRGDMFLGLNPVKEIGNQDPLEFMLKFISERMKEFRCAKTFRVWGQKENGVCFVDVEYIPFEHYLGYTREKYFGKSEEA